MPYWSTLLFSFSFIPQPIKQEKTTKQDPPEPPPTPTLQFVLHSASLSLAGSVQHRADKQLGCRKDNICSTIAHIPSTAFRHLPPNSRIGYATEGALFISAQLSTDAVGALPKFGY